MKMIRIAALLGIFLAAIAHAQATGKKAQVRFLAERVPPGLEEVELVAEKIRSAPFKLPTKHLSLPQEAPARTFDMLPKGKSSSLVNVVLPETGKSFIVMLIPSKTGYQAIVMAANDPKFAPGDVYFYNHANKTVLGYVGKAKFTLSPGKGQAIRPSGAREEGFYDVGFGVKEKEGNRTLSTTRWPIEKQIRSYVFFFTNPGTKRLDFRAVDEFVPPDGA